MWRQGEVFVNEALNLGNHVLYFSCRLSADKGKHFPVPFLQCAAFPVKLRLAFRVCCQVFGNRISECVVIFTVHAALLSLYRWMMACAFRSGSPKNTRSGQIFRRF